MGVLKSGLNDFLKDHSGSRDLKPQFLDYEKAGKVLLQLHHHTTMFG